MQPGYPTCDQAGAVGLFWSANDRAALVDLREALSRLPPDNSAEKSRN